MNDPDILKLVKEQEDYLIVLRVSNSLFDSSGFI